MELREVGSLYFHLKRICSKYCRDCSKNRAPWDVLKMDQLYNLSDALNYKDVSF